MFQVKAAAQPLRRAVTTFTPRWEVSKTILKHRRTSSKPRIKPNNLSGRFKKTRKNWITLMHLKETVDLSQRTTKSNSKQNFAKAGHKTVPASTETSAPSPTERLNFRRRSTWHLATKLDCASSSTRTCSVRMAQGASSSIPRQICKSHISINRSIFIVPKKATQKANNI